MIKASHIIHTILIALLAVNLLSCSNDIDEASEPGFDAGQPMEFSFSFPQDGEGGTTRNTPAKTTFDEGDCVYLTATVNTPGQAEETAVRSTIMEYKNKSWVIKAGSNRLYWPKGATDARFVAYYIPRITDDATVPPTPVALTPTVIPFAKLRAATDDPLIARKTTAHLNGVINLQFAHMMTRLRITGMRSSTTTVNFRCSDYSINNQITFSYSDATGYTHAMSASDDQGITIPAIPSTNSTATEALFFVDVDENAADWLTHKADFILTQSGTDVTDLVTDLSSAELYKMTPGRAYRIYFFSGTTNAAFEAEEAWYTDDDDTEPFATEQQIIDYFAALGPDGLQQDLDFNNIPLSEGLIIFKGTTTTRGITLEKSFNGNHHTIRNVNVRNGLFNEIPSGCTLSNLRLENVSVTADGETTECAGLLAPINKGTISNVRLSGNNTLGTYNVSHVGGLVGRNLGKIENTQISGVLTMDCYAGQLPVGSRFAVGGLVGSNGIEATGSYTITNSSIIAASLITTAGTLTDADACIGGLAGYNAISKSITGSNAHVIVSATQMDALNCYTGGFVGMNRGTIRSCDASGDVTGGTIKPSGSDQISATGGFAGYTSSGTETVAARQAVISGCTATGDVTDTSTPMKQVFTGGFVGFTQIDLLNCSSAGTIILSDPGSDSKIGALAGLLSAEKSISNSFSMSQRQGGTGDFKFTGDDECRTTNCHYLGFQLSPKGEQTATIATADYLNKASVSGYWKWTSSTSTYGGAPYLVKQ